MRGEDDFTVFHDERMRDGVDTGGLEPLILEERTFACVGDGIRHAFALGFHELLYFVQAVFENIHAEDPQAFVVVFLVEFVDVGDGFDTGSAQSAPALEHINFPRFESHRAFSLNPSGGSQRFQADYGSRLEGRFRCGLLGKSRCRCQHE